MAGTGCRDFSPPAPLPSPSLLFQSLEELDLSLNPLGNGSTWALASLVQACPLLTTLKLQGCDFTRAFLQPYRSLLATALRGECPRGRGRLRASAAGARVNRSPSPLPALVAVHLKTLVISHNTLGSAGLELLLQSLPCTTLSHLDVSSVVTKMEEQPVVDPVARYLTQVRGPGAAQAGSVLQQPLARLQAALLVGLWAVLAAPKGTRSVLQPPMLGEEPGQDLAG